MPIKLLTKPGCDQDLIHRLEFAGRHLNNQESLLLVQQSLTYQGRAP